MEPLKFGGIYKDYLWGGNKIKEIFNIKTEVSPVAESWVLSTHPDGYLFVILSTAIKSALTKEKFNCELRIMNCEF